METIRDRAIAYTAEPEYIVDFDNIYHCCNCEGYDDYCLAHAYADGAIEQEAIADKRKEALLQYLEELEAYYRDLGQYDYGKPIRRVIEYVRSMEE